MTVILIYAIYFFLILRFCVVLFNYISNPKLPAAPRNYYDQVSILVTDFTDTTQLARLLQSIRDQDFENYEVIVRAGKGDEAAFRTFGIFAGEDRRFRILEKTFTGPGRQGGLSACRQLAEQATGDYLLFLESAEHIEPGLIYNALYRMKRHSLSLLSLFADQKMKTFGEGQLAPLVNYLFLSLLPLRLVLLSRNRCFAAASGQFMMFDAARYREFQWHRTRGGEPAAGTSIMKQVKELGFRAEVLLADGYLAGRLYSGFRPGLDKLGNSIAALSDRNVPVLASYLLLTFIGYFLTLPVVSMQLAGLALTLIVCMRIMVSLMSNQPVWWNLLFHPLQMLGLAAAILSSICRIVLKNI